MNCWEEIFSVLVDGRMDRPDESITGLFLGDQSWPADASEIYITNERRLSVFRTENRAGEQEWLLVDHGKKTIFDILGPFNSHAEASTRMNELLEEGRKK